MRLLRPSFFVLLIESGVVSSCTRRIHINTRQDKTLSRGTGDGGGGGAGWGR